MCLFIVDKLPPTEPMIFYKVVTNPDRRPPYYSEHDISYFPGNVVTAQGDVNIENCGYDKKMHVLFGGALHLCTTYDRALEVIECLKDYEPDPDEEESLSQETPLYMIITVKGLPEDFVAWGNEQVAYRKVEVLD